MNNRPGPTIRAHDLKKHYTITPFLGESKIVKALDGVSFDLLPGQTLGVVGESGCGKSTLANTLMGLLPKTSGELYFDQRKDNELSLRDWHHQIQMVFQDPYSSLNPRKKAWQIVAAPLFINANKTKEECKAQALDLFKKVGLGTDLAERYPHMLSGGQRQRLNIARALALRPKVLICDEPVSALDVSIQAQVLNLLVEIQEQFKLSMIFISHDLNVVKHISHKIMVMYLGKVVEFGDREQVMESPLHPYTQALIQSSPTIDKNSRTQGPLSGELPSPLSPPSGCAFHKRCPLATDKCKSQTPVLKNIKGRDVACLLLD